MVYVWICFIKSGKYLFIAFVKIKYTSSSGWVPIIRYFFKSLMYLVHKNEKYLSTFKVYLAQLRSIPTSICITYTWWRKLLVNAPVQYRYNYFIIYRSAKNFIHHTVMKYILWDTLTFFPVSVNSVSACSHCTLCGACNIVLCHAVL